MSATCCFCHVLLVCYSQENAELQKRREVFRLRNLPHAPRYLLIYNIQLWLRGVLRKLYENRPARATPGSAASLYRSRNGRTRGHSRGSHRANRPHGRWGLDLSGKCRLKCLTESFFLRILILNRFFILIARPSCFTPEIAPYSF